MKRPTISNLLFFKKRATTRHYGLKNERKGYYHPWKEFNIFRKNAVKIPKNFSRIKPPKTSWVKKYIANTKSHRISEPTDFTPKEHEYYEICDNRYTPYVVYVNSERTTVSIYRIPKNGYVTNKDWNKNRSKKYVYFTELVKRYNNVENIITGIDYKEGMNGNSMLIQSNKNTYVYIGDCIYSFRPREQITQYFSNMGNNLVPYPVAVSKSYVYFMLDKVYVDKREFPEVDFSNEEQVADMYTEFYKIKSPRGKRIPHYRLIKKRLI